MTMGRPRVELVGRTGDRTIDDRGRGDGANTDRVLDRAASGVVRETAHGRGPELGARFESRWLGCICVPDGLITRSPDYTDGAA